MAQGWVQIAVFVAIVIALTPPLGAYMARVYTGQRVFLSPVLAPVERLTYRVLRVDPAEEHDWKAYAKALVLFSVFSWVVLYLILRTQGIHPFNPEGFHSGPWDVSFNTASSFVSNTNWQYYGGETTLTYFSQMAGLTVQNFVTPAVGICVLVAMIRGIVSRSGPGLGNFWQDLTRSLYYVLLPLSVIVGLVLVSQGVVQTLSGARVADTRSRAAEQALAFGPAASQIAIKQLGTNGGGFFNVNSAMPFENANQLTNFVELLSIILIPAALTYTYGRMVGRQREGWAIFAAMLAIYLAFIARDRPGRAARHPRRARRRHADRARSTARPAATWKARSSATGSPTRRSGRRRPPSPPTARSTPPTTPTPASAAPCRCRASAPARSSSAASAPASTRCCSTSCWRSSSAA